MKHRCFLGVLQGQANPKDANTASKDKNRGRVHVTDDFAGMGGKDTVEEAKEKETEFSSFSERETRRSEQICSWRSAAAELASAELKTQSKSSVCDDCHKMR